MTHPCGRNMEYGVRLEVEYALVVQAVGVNPYKCLLLTS